MAVYADYNATTPLSKEAKRAIIGTLNVWGNPSSAHVLGKSASSIVHKSRAQVAALINADAEEILFNSGGTEGNNHVIFSAIEAFRAAQPGEIPHVVTTTIEHDATLKPLRHWLLQGKCDVTHVSPNPCSGAVEVDAVLEALRPTTALVTLMLANNETGVLQPVGEVGARLRGRGVPLHTDAAQAIGKLRVDVRDLGADYLTLVGHKFYGPRIGALFVRKGAGLLPMLFGGGQEGGLRPGTENVPMVAGLGAAAAAVEAEAEAARLSSLRDALESGLLSELGEDRVALNFASSARLPNTTSVSFPSLRGPAGALLEACSPDFLASTGAACHSGQKTASPILLASGVSESAAFRTLRLSLGRSTTLADVDVIVGSIVRNLPLFE